MSPYFADRDIMLYEGHAVEVARWFAPQSVQAIVTSPPYYGLRNYGHDDQVGTEKSLEDYVAHLVDIFHALRPAVADDGLLWLNLGDTYSGRANGARAESSQDRRRALRAARPSTTAAAPAKNLLGVPWRVAFALQADGWILRSEVIWHKPNPMPESVKDRPTKAHEHFFMFAKSSRYYYDAAAISDPLAPSSVKRLAENVSAQTGSLRGNGEGKVVKALAPRFGGTKHANDDTDHRASGNEYKGGGRANKRDVWTIGGAGFKGAHFAVMPPELARPPILCSSRPGDIILDPFSGSGTTGMVALQEGRRYLGIDVSADYLDLSLETRFKGRRSNGV